MNLETISFEIAIEFANWILQHKNPVLTIQHGDRELNKWRSTTIGGEAYTTKELFRLYLTEKYDRETKTSEG
jgi:hypothetical protein